MTSKVYFTREINEKGMKNLFQSVWNESSFDADDRVCVKTHFGERGNTGFPKPNLTKQATDIIKEKCKDIFVTDTNTLYVGMRTNAADHVQIAKEHGFDVLDVPIIIADGHFGDEEEDVEVNLSHFSHVKIGKEIVDSDSMLVVSHFKGHMIFGFGGAVKNLGMGCGSRAGKLAMHSKMNPSIGDACIGCGKCISKCQVQAIEMNDTKAFISDKCVGCAGCIPVCPVKAIQIPWGGATPVEVQERCAEYSYGAVKDKKVIYVTIINQITKLCDCAPDSDIIGNDVGIVAGTDPVACDQACYDLVKERHEGKDIFMDAGNPDGKHILDYSEKVGLGKKKYELMDLDEA